MRSSLLIVLACIALVGCVPEDTSMAVPVDPSTLRVAVAQFSHETCTFCPGGDTTVEDWTRLGPPLKGQELLD